MATVHALMGLLARGARHGYDLRRELAEELGPEWRIDFGQLYRLLATMTRKGWVTARIERGTQGPDRKVYTLSRRGRTELQRWLQLPAAPAPRERDEFAVKLRFGLATPGVPLRALVAERRRVLEAQRQTQRRTSERARQADDAGRWLIAEAGARQTEAALEALQSCAAVIRLRRGAARVAGHELVAIGSDDLLLDLLARFLTERYPETHVSVSRVGSLAGLIALREGRAHLAGIHLLDMDSGDYNLPFVKHLLPEEPVVLLHLAQREQGMMVAPDNPKGIRGVKDLARRGVRLINRQRGAGTRLFLFHRLRAANVDPRTIAGFADEVPTHNAVAAAVAAGSADVGPGIRAVAEAWGLGFVPLGHERYDLAIPRPIFDSPRLRGLLDVLHARAFRDAAARLNGYDLSRMSQIVAEVR